MRRNQWKEQKPIGVFLLGLGGTEGLDRLDWLRKRMKRKKRENKKGSSRQQRAWGGEWVGRFRREKGMNASERVQRTVGALVVAPVSWDCAYGVAERRVEDLRTGQDPGGMIRYEPLRPVSFPVLACCPVFTVVLAFLSQPLRFYFTSP